MSQCGKLFRKSGNWRFANINGVPVASLNELMEVGDEVVASWRKTPHHQIRLHFLDD